MGDLDPKCIKNIFLKEIQILTVKYIIDYFLIKRCQPCVKRSFIIFFKILYQNN